jgi:hypothetical protein
MNLRYVIMSSKINKLHIVRTQLRAPVKYLNVGHLVCAELLHPEKQETATFVLKHTSPSGERRIYYYND